MIGPEQLAAGERAETAGDYVAAAAAYRAVAEVSDEQIVAQAQFCLGRVSWRQGRFDAALVSFESARALARRLDDTELQARVENGVGAVHYARGDYAAARQAYGAALALSKDRSLHGRITINLGVIENIEGNLHEARAHYQSAVELFEKTGDMLSAMLALHNRGMLEADLEEWSEADRFFLRSLELATAQENREMIAKTLVNRSEVLVHQGELVEAVEHCDRALEIYADVGDEVGRGEAMRWRANALGRLGELAEAERNATAALHIAMRSGARLLEAESARDLGILRSQLGDRAGGMKQLRRALMLFTELGARRDAAETAALIQRPTPTRSLERVE